jgi:hypothetical protein
VFRELKIDVIPAPCCNPTSHNICTVYWIDVGDGDIPPPPTGGGGGGGGGSGGDSGPARMSVTEECLASGWVPLPPSTNCSGDLDCDGFPDQIIIDNLTDPCLKHTLSFISQNNYLGSTIGQMLFSIFGVSKDQNVVFLQTDTLPDFKDGNTHSVISNLGAINSQIRLNLNILPNASKEYVAAVMLHECLHAYLHYNSFDDSLSNHNYIANNYIDLFQNSLHQLFPNLDSMDVKALAWGGLPETNAWDSIQTNHPLLYDTLRVRNAMHRVRTRGTICN